MAPRSTHNSKFNSIPTDRGMILPSYSGVAFLLSWIYLLFYANSAGIEAAAPISLMGTPYTLSSILMSIVVIVIAFGPTRLSEQIMSSKMKIASSLGTSIGTLFMVASSYIDAFWILLIGSAITGIFSGILAQQWVVAYKRVGLKAMISSFPALLAVSVGICMTVMYLPRTIILMVTALMPIISGFMLHSVRKSLFPFFDLETDVTDRPLDFAIVLFPIGIFAFASGFLDFFSYQSGYTYFFYTTVSAVLLITACVFVLITNRESAFVCLVIPMCFFICIFVPFFSMFDHIPASHFISIGELGIEIALFSIAVGFADFFSINSLKTYALCRVVHFVLNSIGWYAGSFSNFALNDMMNSQASLAVVFVGVEVVAVCLIVAVVKAQKTLPQNIEKTDTITSTANSMVLQQHEFDGQTAAHRSIEKTEGGDVRKEPSPLETDSTHHVAFDSLSICTDARESTLNENPIDDEARLNAKPMIHHESANSTSLPDPKLPTVDTESRLLSLGKDYGLSNREMDVFALLARGYSASAIQSELYIAPGTVNYHTRNIYSKLGVHSKQELISLVADHS